MKSLCLGLLAYVVPAASIEPYRPLIIMHGMNGRSTDFQRQIANLTASFPGMYIRSLPVYDGSASVLTDMHKQLAVMVEMIQSDANLKQGFNFYGESQGALLARTYVTLVNDPPVYNLVALNGPQNGVGECPSVEIPWLKYKCGDLGTDLDIYHWPFCSFCGYWRGKHKQTYLDNSEFIADVNNDRAPNETRRQNMISLNKYMATVALRDEVVQPRESAWHTYWYWDDDTRSKVMPYNETDGYKSDVLGLKTLDQRGDLILNSFDGAHTEYPFDWWVTTVKPMFDNRLPAAEASTLVI